MFAWIDDCLVLQVRGLMDKSDKQDKSNLDSVLQLFHEKGYLVAHRLVTPEKVGVPMSRQRFHFQALRVGAAANEEEARFWLQDLEAAWDAILASLYAPLPLEKFLMKEESPEFQQYVQRLKSNSQVGRCQEKPDPAWKSMHELVFKHNKATFCSANLRSYFTFCRVIEYSGAILATRVRSNRTRLRRRLQAMRTISGSRTCPKESRRLSRFTMW